MKNTVKKKKTSNEIHSERICNEIHWEKKACNKYMLKKKTKKHEMKYKKKLQWIYTGINKHTMKNTFILKHEIKIQKKTCNETYWKKKGAMKIH